MPAPTGNNNASQWTREKTHQLLDQIEKLAWDESIYTLSQALLQLKRYKQLWSYLKKIWELDGDIMDRIYYIEQIFITKLEEGALFKKLNPSACYFILRNNYGYGSKGEDELPSHLRADLEQQEETQAATGSKTKTGQAEKQHTTGQKNVTAPSHQSIGPLQTDNTDDPRQKPQTQNYHAIS